MFQIHKVSPYRNPNQDSKNDDQTDSKFSSLDELM